jgi:hypothetical protein
MPWLRLYSRLLCARLGDSQSSSLKLDPSQTPFRAARQLHPPLLLTARTAGDSVLA